MAQRLIFICSAATTAMRRGAFALDEPADARYLARAAALAGHLPRAGQVLAGPALRARQTAEALAATVAEEGALADQDFGAWAGKRLSEVQETDPVALVALLSDPEASPPGGESFARVCRRIEGFMAGLLDKKGETIAISHPAVIRAAILTTLGAPRACFSRIDVEPLGLTEFRGDGRRWMLRSTGTALSANE